MEKKLKKIKTKEEKRQIKRNLYFGLIIGLVLGIIFFILKRNMIISLIITIASVVLFLFYIYVKNILKESARIRKIESIFPDFLSLMASNLRAGMTIDKAMFLSSRKEFYPLDEEVMKTGKDITTGKSIETSLLNLSSRIGSKNIHKTILLIISGIRAGGDLAVLLEETSVNTREKTFVEKKAASSVLMYVIFIFLAVGLFAPALFSLSSILVEVLSSLLNEIPSVDASMNIPFTLSSINVSVTFIKYFAVVFMIVIDILASLVLGLVGKGEEKEGVKYMIPLLVLSITVFFTIRLALSGFIAGLFPT